MITQLLTSALSWGASNLKTVLIILALAAGSWLVWNYIAKIEEASRLSYTVEVQRETIAAKDRIITGMVAINNANNKTIEERDAELENIASKLDGLLENLGDDIDNEAPQSLQELMRRLGK